MKTTSYDTINGSVESKVKAVVDSMNESVTYLYHNWAQANVAIDDIEGPTILYVLPTNGTLDVQWHSVKDNPESFIAFIDKAEFDFDGGDKNNIVERMKRLAIKFICALNKSGMFDVIEGNLRYQVLYDHLDMNVTGVVINPILKETDGIRTCGESNNEDVI